MKRLAALIALFASPALAQQQQEASPEVQAVSSKLMREISEGLRCQAASIKLTKENETLKEQIKELESKSNVPVR